MPAAVPRGYAAAPMAEISTLCVLKRKATIDRGRECGGSVNRVSAGGSPADSRWHLQECRAVSGPSAAEEPALSGFQRAQWLGPAVSLLQLAKAQQLWDVWKITLANRGHFPRPKPE